MIDLTPLDVRKKRGDFGRGFRGYEPQEVDGFLDLVAERMEVLVKENLTLRERVDRLAEQVTSQTGRERAVHEALVTAQELRDEIQGNAQREAGKIVEDARREGRKIVAEAEARIAAMADSLHELERRRKRFLQAFRHMLERELDVVAIEEDRTPLEEARAIDMDLGGGRPVGVAPRGGDDVHRLAAEAETVLDDGAVDLDEDDHDTPGDAFLELEVSDGMDDGAPGGVGMGEFQEPGIGGERPAPDLWQPNFPGGRSPRGDGGDGGPR